MKNRKIVLVTGGSRGLGRDMALRIAKKDMDLIVTYRDQAEAAKDTVQEIEKAGGRGYALPLDMKDVSSLEPFVKQVGDLLSAEWSGSSLYGIVNNAGMGATVPFDRVTEDLFDTFLNVHFKGVFFLTQKLLPLLEKGGRIINISTGTTRFSNPGYSVYASMKGAIEVFTKYLAKELGPRGIRANVVAPGPIETDFNAAAIRSNPDMKARLGGLTPLGRVGQAEDIGGVVAFLLSEDAGWINGQRIEVSGGINI
jgi:NAD(P)-dependent dehydrogenase (short-subunit alcohol dehydrogenase family)